MKVKQYAVHDSAVKAFARPFQAATHDQARRIFELQVMNSDTTIGLFPDQYCLYYCGEFDDQAGVFETLDSPELIASGVQVKNSSKLDDLSNKNTVEETEK